MGDQTRYGFENDRPCMLGRLVLPQPLIVQNLSALPEVASYQTVMARMKGVIGMLSSFDLDAALHGLVLAGPLQTNV
jgi:hypothetical protein